MHTVPGSPLPQWQPASSQQAPPPTRQRRPAWLWVLLGIAAIILLALSNCAGFLSGSLVARGEQTELRQELNAALEHVTVAEASQVEAESAQAEAEAQVIELSERIEVLEQREIDLDAVSADLATTEQERDDALAQVEQLEARVAELEAAAAAAASETARPAPLVGDTSDGGAGAGGGSAYYGNCDAARAAGAAPLHVGEPGYRAGLDRDGDGVACE